MATIQKFEDIDAWQKARELVKVIYSITNQGSFARDFGLRDQIRRAAVSIMSNIAEGFGRGGNREFIQFLSTARGSASEVQAQLYVALDADYITKEQFRQLYDLAQSSGKLIGGFIRYLQKSEHKGAKYK
ncbi:MAG: four helix bundle protein [Deltaproteobacteria bacterium]|nr:MAG: four helix bundle protein [Deltaproteobacteria bacterium]